MTTIRRVVIIGVAAVLMAGACSSESTASKATKVCKHFASQHHSTAQIILPVLVGNARSEAHTRHLGQPFERMSPSTLVAVCGIEKGADLSSLSEYLVTFDGSHSSRFVVAPPSVTPTTH